MKRSRPRSVARIRCITIRFTGRILIRSTRRTTVPHPFHLIHSLSSTLAASYNHLSSFPPSHPIAAATQHLWLGHRSSITLGSFVSIVEAYKIRQRFSNDRQDRRRSIVESPPDIFNRWKYLKKIAELSCRGKFPSENICLNAWSPGRRGHGRGPRAR